MDEEDRITFDPSKWTGGISTFDPVHLIGLVVAIIAVIAWTVLISISPPIFLSNVATEFIGIILEISVVVTLLDWLASRRERRRWSKALKVAYDDIGHHLDWSLQVLDEFINVTDLHFRGRTYDLPYPLHDLGDKAEWTKKEGRHIANQHQPALALDPEFSHALAQSTELCDAIQSYVDQLYRGDTMAFDQRYMFENCCYVSSIILELSNSDVWGKSVTPHWWWERLRDRTRELGDAVHSLRDDLSELPKAPAQ